MRPDKATYDEGYLMHYYPHHIGDFIKDTSRLSDSQCMAYLRLIWMYYESESPLPDDPKMLAFKVGSDEQTIAMLLQCYFYANALHWHHKRIDAVLEEYKNKSKKASDSAKARWNNAKGMQSHSDGNAKPITKNQKPKEKKESDTQDKPARFDPMVMDLPESVKPSAWESWIEYRRSRNLTCKEITMQAQLKNLDAWWNNGHDPNSIIQASISNGWQGLFEPKGAIPASQVKPTMTNAEIAKLAMSRMREMQDDRE